MRYGQGGSVHQYKRKYNGRGQRQASKVLKGINKKYLVNEKILKRISWEKQCSKFIYKYSKKTDRCSNCKNYLCENNI